MRKKKDAYEQIFGKPYKYPKPGGGPRTVKGVKSQMTKLRKRFRKDIFGF